MSNVETCPAGLGRTIDGHTYQLDCVIEPDKHYEVDHRLANGIGWKAGEEAVAQAKLASMPKPNPGRRDPSK